MKTLKGLALVLLLLVPASFVSPQQGYPIICRGGGDVYFNYTPYSNFSPDPQIWITFKKAPQGAGQNWEHRHNLQPGQAAWPDRGIAANEPDKFIVLNVKEFTISWTGGKVMGVSSVLTYLSVLMDANRFQVFNAYNDGNGNFIVTGIGPAM